MARNFQPPSPNRLWVAELTFVSTWSGWVYVAFVVDAYARRILGWRTATTMTTGVVLDALEQAIWTRRREGHTDLSGLVHHNDRGSQGGFNRCSQHLDMEVCDGTTTGLDARADGDCPMNGVSGGFHDHRSPAAGIRSAKVTANALRAGFHLVTHRV